MHAILHTGVQGGFQLFYRLYQDRGDKPLIDEGITNFTLNVVDRATGGFTELTTDQGTDNNATFIFNLTVVCKENYYGSDCSVLSFCEPQDDDTLGHYTCDSNGTLVCLTGYQSSESNCTKAISVTTELPTTDPLTTPATVATTDPPTKPITVATTDPPTTPTTVATTNPATTLIQQLLQQILRQHLQQSLQQILRQHLQQLLHVQSLLILS